MNAASALSRARPGLLQQIQAAYREVPCPQSTRELIADTVRSFHRPSPLATKHSEGQHMLGRSSSARNFQSTNDRKIPAHEISQSDLATIVSAALDRAFGGTDAAIKRVQAVANCNERAARNWVEGKNAPNALYLLRLIAEVPELQAEVRRLTAMEANLDPEFGRAMSEAVRLFHQMRRP